ncbi:MAG: ATP-grasp domain-containing protein, partial [Planctomycetia bacterium]|nr:ATP-grasp domain-containing protein [Planctomycetia bacterium]
MEIRKVLALRGPNIWARFPVLEAWVDLQELKDSPSNILPGFNERVMAWLPGMIEHRCGLGYRGGFFERMRDGTYQGHILEHVTLELEDLAGTPAGFGKARETSEEGVYKVVIEYEDETVGRACLDTAFRLLQAAVHDLPFDVDDEIKRLRDLAYLYRMGPSTKAIVEAAVARGIPYRRIDADDLVMLGQGHRQRRILMGETDRTGAIAESISKDKNLTREFLRAVGVPTPRGRSVSDADDAWEAAEEIGTPVTVKPKDANQGRGVTTGVTTREQIAAAYDFARTIRDEVLVERHVPGADHRILVVDGRVVAAARREPAHVIGDALTSIAGLVEKVNEDPLRGDGFLTPLYKIELNPQALELIAEQGYGSPDAVPPAGARVLLHRRMNISYGGISTDVTPQVHPEVAARVVDAARVVGLDIAGIDVMAEDIGRPLEEQGGAVIEVNA